MRNVWFKNALVVGIIALFIGMSVVSSTGVYIGKFSHTRINERSSLSDLSDSRCYSMINTGQSQHYFWFDPEDLGTFHYIKNVSFPSSCFIQGSTFVKDEWWVCDQTGALAILDTETAEAEYIGNSGVGELVGLAYHEISGVLYGMSINKLYMINMTTGKATLVGCMNNSGIMISLDCDKDGIMYSYELNKTNGKFYTLDLETGEANFIGYTEVALNYGQDMVYDLDEEKMYACILNLDTWQGEFHEIDLKTGVFTYIGTLKNGAHITNLAIPYCIMNQPPSKPEIDGLKRGKVGVEYEYNFSIYDPDGDSMHIRIDWEHGTPGKWDGPFLSGSVIKYNYTWRKRGSYAIRAQTMDTYGAMSDWGELTVTMPRYRAITNSLLLWFLDRFTLVERLLNIFGWNTL